MSNPYPDNVAIGLTRELHCPLMYHRDSILHVNTRCTYHTVWMHILIWRYNVHKCHMTYYAFTELRSIFGRCIMVITKNRIFVHNVTVLHYICFIDLLCASISVSKDGTMHEKG